VRFPPHIATNLSSNSHLIAALLIFASENPVALLPFVAGIAHVNR
jgi:hypothetical protein